MGKIIASYLVKVHLHAPESLGELEQVVGEGEIALTNDQVKDAIVAGLAKALGIDEVTVSLIERTDD